jgi:acyl carrier protein
MTRDEVRASILNILASLTEEDLSRLDPASSLREQLGLDSMDFLDVVMELRKRYRIEVPEADYMQLATLDSCLDYLAPRMRQLNP